MGNYSVNLDGVMYSVRGLEEKPHILKVSLKNNVRQKDYMDTEESISTALLKQLALLVV